MGTTRYSNLATITINPNPKLKAIKEAREKGDFDSVKRLSKKELEDPQSDITPLRVMNEIVHMYLDLSLIWINEMKKIDGSVNKCETFRKIAQELEDKPNQLVWFTQYMKEMIDADAEEVRNIFLSVDDDIEKVKETMKDQLL